MSIERWTHNWEPYRNDWERVPGKPDCFVKTKRMPAGFIWVCGKEYGFADTLGMAKEWAETAREIWPRKLPKG